ncbi:hypothetical protein J2795_004259 [Chryseobacterium bernardetii]|jgi:hypothetical protein|uniref:Lipoprotein n=2 Tax=Chryseobacterium TaxID=59732 RepID=A0A543DV14_9FLAO|nr:MULTISPECIES: hypothetical protein [Chryseobacterium]MDR6373070.1 hypothetical protein [Chryseobacterium vietnamense]MDR6443508.1 hypothetical protein [Chryseobacterium bernardetii]TQM13170.1 hypothetical protein FB551_4540 [Chryseobacterium aquifrigidense]
MKKTLFVISSLFLIGCANSNDLIYSQDENSIPKNTTEFSLVSKNILAKSAAESVIMDLSFTTGVINENGGCSFTDLISPQGSYFTSTKCYGPNPIEQNGYQIRGYGKPRRRPSYNTSYYWHGVMLKAENRGKIVTSTRGGTTLVNDPISNAISIEQYFEPNKTYEIIVTTNVEDYIYTTKNNNRDNRLDDDLFNIDKSEAYATLALEVADSPQIPGDLPCADRPNVGRKFVSANYYKTQKTEKTTHWTNEDKTYTFYFSTLEPKNALIIYYLPEQALERPASHVPQSAMWLDIRNIKIIKKTYDPSHFVPPRVTTPDPSVPCGFRGGC